MKPTLPAYQVRVRPRSNSYSSSPSSSSSSSFSILFRIMYALPLSLLAAFAFLAITARPILPPNGARHPRFSISASAPSAFFPFQFGAADAAAAAQRQQSGRRLHSQQPAPVHTASVNRQAQLDLQRQQQSQQAGRDASASTGDANIAFFIQVSDMTVGHLPRLLARIYHTENAYAIHIDRKVDESLAADTMASIFRAHPGYKRNVFVMPSELITYRGVSMVLNTINAMQTLLRNHAHWDYFVNLSGADYPLVSQHVMRSELGTQRGKRRNFITFTPNDKWAINIAYRMEGLYVDEALSFQTEPGSVTQLPRVQNPLARSLRIQYANAEAWMINSRELCEFVVSSGYARKLLLTFAYSVEASEHYFSTLVWNHPRFNRTIVRHAMRHVLWKFEGEHSGQHPYFVDAMGADGVNFRFQSVLDTSSNFFIRKLKRADSAVMDFLDSRWKNETHVARVREKFRIAISKADEENEGKPEVASDE